MIGTSYLVNRCCVLETLSLGKYLLEVFYLVIVLAVTGHEYFAFIDIGVGNST